MTLLKRKEKWINDKELIKTILNSKLHSTLLDWWLHQLFRNVKIASGYHLYIEYFFLKNYSLNVWNCLVGWYVIYLEALLA